MWIQIARIAPVAAGIMSVASGSAAVHAQATRVLSPQAAHSGLSEVHAVVTEALELTALGLEYAHEAENGALSTEERQALALDFTRVQRDLLRLPSGVQLYGLHPLLGELNGSVVSDSLSLTTAVSTVVELPSLDRLLGRGRLVAWLSIGTVEGARRAAGVLGRLDQLLRRISWHLAAVRGLANYTNVYRDSSHAPRSPGIGAVWLAAEEACDAAEALRQATEGLAEELAQAAAGARLATSATLSDADRAALQSEWAARLSAIRAIANAPRILGVRPLRRELDGAEILERDPSTGAWTTHVWTLVDLDPAGSEMATVAAAGLDSPDAAEDALARAVAAGRTVGRADALMEALVAFACAERGSR